MTVTFAPSETEKIVNVSVLNDDTFESTETFTAMLTAVPGSMAMIGILQKEQRLPKSSK